MSENTANLLWVEKYRPKHLQDYLGNRQTLRDIKSWINGFKNVDAVVKPFLVLHGRPGVGKTTLAHIIFSEYGFDTVEYNASDNRTKKTIYETIGTIGKFSVSILEEGKGRQQVGLIMDEVDGLAGGINGGVDELVSIVCVAPSKRQRGRPPLTSTASKKGGVKKGSGSSSSNGNDDGITTTTKKANTKANSNDKYKASFPVICTCNSIKDKKLAPLLKEALVVKIPQPKPADLLAIGRRIATAEKLTISDDELTKIINKGNRDYRAFIFNLFQWSLNPDYEIRSDSGNSEDDSEDGEDMQEQHDYSQLEMSETPLGKLGHFINSKNYDMNDILRYIESDSNIYFLGIYANWLTILKDLGIFPNPNPNPNESIISIVKELLKNVSEADIIHHRLYDTQIWECETYKNYIGSVRNIIKLRNLNKSQHLFYLQHHSKFNQMASETATLARKFESMSAPNSIIGSTVHNAQSLFYAFPLINKKQMVKKDYEDIEKIFKIVKRSIH
jgi:DNA polymerase III delta prime subunit